jgi:hypothetical protein
MSRKILFIFVSLAIIAGIFAAGLLVNRRPGAESLNLTDKIQLPMAVANTAVPFGNDTVVYSNDRALATFNYKSGATAIISPMRPGSNLGAIDSLSASSDQKYLLFHVNIPEAGSLLDDRLKQLKLNSSADYWWVYSTEQKTFTPLPAGITLAKFGDNTIYTVSGLAPSQKLTGYNPDSLGQQTALSILPTSNFFFTSHGYLIQTPDGKVLLTEDGLTSKQVASSASIIGVTADGNTAIVTQKGEQSNGNNKELLSIPLDNPSTSRSVAKEVVGEPVMSPQSGAVIYAMTGSGDENAPDRVLLYSYDIATAKTSQWFAPDASKDGSTVLGATTALDNQTAVLQDQNSGNKFIVGNGLAEIKPPDTQYQQTIQVGGSPVTIVYDDQSYGFIAYPRLADKQAELNAIVQQLTTDKFKPDLFRITLTDTTD